MSMRYHLIRHEKKDSLSGSTMFHYRHNSGFGLTYLPKPGFSKKYLAILVPCGGDTLTFKDPESEETLQVPPGTAHLLEHVIFRRGANEDPEASLLARLSAMGIEANAYTAQSHTLFYFTCVESALGGMQVLLDALRHPDFVDEAIEIERRIIQHEVALYYDEPDHLLFRQVLTNLFVNHPVKHDIAGSGEDLASIQKWHLEALHRVFYRQNGLHMVIVGDIDEPTLIETLGPILEDVGPELDPEVMMPEEPMEVAVTSSVVEGPVLNPLFALAWKDPSVRVDADLSGSALQLRRLAGQMYFEMLLGESSPLVDELFAQGYIDESFDFEYICEKDCAYLMLYGESMDPDETCRIICERLPSFIEEAGLDEEAFNRQRRAALGETMRAIDDIESCGEAAVEAALSSIDLFDVPPLFERAEIYRSAETMNFIRHEEGRTRVIIVPPFDQEGDLYV